MTDEQSKSKLKRLELIIRLTQTNIAESIMNVNYPCGCEGEITLHFSNTYLDNNRVQSCTKLSKVCQHHQNLVRQEFIENTKKDNEKRLSMAQSSPIGVSF